MQGIVTQPHFSEDEFISLVNNIEQYNTPFIDGKVLSSLVRAAFYCGLKKSEIINLNIGDVVDRVGNISPDAKCGQDLIPVGKQGHLVFQDHFAYLKMKGYSTIKSAPLFPTRKKTRYDSRQLQYNLEKCMGLPKSNIIGLEKIRQSGICRFYERLKVDGRSPNECLQETKRFARCTLRHVEGILMNKIIPAGRKPDPFWDYMKIIEKIEYSHNPSDKTILTCKDRIEKESKLKPREKNALLSELQRVNKARVHVIDSSPS